MSKKLQDNLAKAQRRHARIIGRGLLAMANVLLDESQKLVPRDTYALKDTGRAYLISSGMDVQAVVGYGRKDVAILGVFSPHENRRVDRIPAEYAVIVHEDPTQPVGKIYPSGQTNYLEEPRLTKQPEMRQAFEAEINSGRTG